MNTLLDTTPASESFPKVLRYCRRCCRETTHEIRGDDEILVCNPCLQRALDYEMDRD